MNAYKEWSVKACRAEAQGCQLTLVNVPANLPPSYVSRAVCSSLQLPQQI